MRKTFSALTLSMLLLAVFPAGIAPARAQSAANQGPQPITPALQQRAEAMVQKLTLDQKIDMIGGVDSMFIRAEPSIGFPRLKMSDGPMGVRTWGPSTAYAAGIGLAASWDTALAREIGVGLGEDARARGVNFLLGPGVNIYRAPMDGRNFEFFGEDPYLAGKIAVGYIDGVQSQGVIATIKHFDANNSEYDRHNINSIINQRALREIYLPAFEMAVKEAHVGAVMDSYNLINGEHATQNKFLNIDVLRKDWGFKGILMSDWDATYSTVAAANGGLDLEMPSGKFFNQKDLLPAIKSGQVTEATINTKVLHILRTAMQFNFLSRDQLDPNIPLYNHHGSEIALRAAEEDAVLLKNDGHLLPLNRNSVHTIAVIGPDAYPAVPTAGGSANVTAFAPVSFMTGLSDTLYPGIKVYWNSGLPTLAEIFRDTKWCVDAACQQRGLRRNETIAATNAPVSSGIDRMVNQASGREWGERAKTPHRVVWTGYFVPKATGDYRFVALAIGGARYALTVNGKQILDAKQLDGGDPQSAKISLQSGQAAKVQFTYFPARAGIHVGLGVIAENEMVNPEAIQLAKMADVVVLSVGFDARTESEGFDRTYQLPLGQDKLIRTIAAANPHTIVVLTSGGSVATNGWLDKVPVFLQTWYAGQEAGLALPKILFGEVDPGGKLPISWPTTVEENPTYKNYYERGGSRDVKYSEGIFVGYRYYDSKGVKPLFPFGFGLSYTTFKFSNLSVSPDVTSPNGPITVSFDVKNTGSRSGAEVAQIYVGDPSATVPRPKMELKGFSRVALAPGEVRHISATLDKRSLAYWDTQMHGWKVDPGKFLVYVGDSSENVPLQKSFQVK